MECKRAKNLLDAYLDEELDTLHSLEVESHLQDCRRCAAVVQGRRVLREAIRTHLPMHRAPDTLRRKLVAVERSRPRAWFRPLAMAACLAIVAGGTWIAATRFGAQGIDHSALLADAIEASHVRSLLLTEHLADVISTDQHTVKPWFAGKLPYTPPVADPAAEGFPLEGGRLDVIDGHAVAALVYQRRKHTINLFVWPATDGPQTPEARSTPRGFHIVHWNQGGMTYWAVSDVSMDELQKFAAILMRPAATLPAAKN